MSITKKFLFIGFLVMVGCSTPQLERPTEDAVPMSQEANRLVHAGIKFKESGDYDSALKKLLAAISENRNNVVAYYELSDTYLLMGDYENAQRFAEKGLKYKSDIYPRIAINASKCYRQANDFNKSIKVLSFAIEDNEDIYDLYIERSISYKMALEYDSASYDLKSYIKLNPLDQEGHVKLADLYKYKLEFSKALTIYYFALMLNPNTDDSKRIIENLRFLIDESLIKKKPNEIDFELDIIGASKIKIEENLNSDDMPKLYKEFYKSLMKESFFEEFMYFIHTNSNYPGVKAWIVENEENLQPFYDWVNKYNYY